MSLDYNDVVKIAKRLSSLRKCQLLKLLGFNEPPKTLSVGEAAVIWLADLLALSNLVGPEQQALIIESFAERILEIFNPWLDEPNDVHCHLLIQDRRYCHILDLKIPFKQLDLETGKIEKQKLAKMGIEVVTYNLVFVVGANKKRMEKHKTHA